MNTLRKQTVILCSDFGKEYMMSDTLVMCGRCGIEPAAEGFRYCENCLFVMAIWRRKLRQKDDPIGFDRTDEDADDDDSEGYE